MQEIEFDYEKAVKKEQNRLKKLFKDIPENKLKKAAEFKTKYCNIKQNSSLAWLPASAVVKCSGEELSLESFRSSYCVGGIDLSMAGDLTSACVVIEKNGVFYVISHCWLPEEKLEEAIAKDGVPYREMMQKGFLDFLLNRQELSKDARNRI